MTVFCVLYVAAIVVYFAGLTVFAAMLHQPSERRWKP